MNIKEIEEAIENLSEEDFKKLCFNTLSKTRDQLTRDRKEELDIFLSEVIANKWK